MKLIMKSEFDNLRLNPAHQYSTDRNGDKQVVKIYCKSELIAKKIKLKKSIRYFGIESYQSFIATEDDL